MITFCWLQGEISLEDVNICNHLKYVCIDIQMDIVVAFHYKLLLVLPSALVIFPKDRNKDVTFTSVSFSDINQ